MSIIKNIIEEIIIPEVPRIIDSQQIYVYVPTATTGTPGIASFNNDKFIVVDGKVNIKDIYTERYDTNNIPDYVQYSVDGLKTPNTWYYNNDGAILVTYKEGIQSEFDVTNNRFRELIIVDGVVTSAGPWRSIFDDLGNINDDINSIFNALDTKVDKILGKGLSTNDYTTPEKTKLATLTDLSPNVSSLETLTANLASNKLDKVTTGGFAAYTHVGSTQTQTFVSQSALNGAIVQRISGGQITVPATPSNNTDATSKQYVDGVITTEATTRGNADLALSQRIEAQDGLGGFLDAHDFGTDTPYIHNIKDLITPYALSQIPSINNDETKIWNGTRVTNLFDGNVWQLTNTQNTDPIIFEWANIGAASISKASADTFGFVKTGDNVKIRANGDLYTSPALIGAATTEQFEELDASATAAAQAAQDAAEFMMYALGTTPIWDAEGEYILADAEDENTLADTYINAAAINGRELYVMTKAAHNALVQAGTYIPDALYLTF